jgi:hypothetical protein
MIWIGGQMTAFFYVQHTHVLLPYGACAPKRSWRFCGVPSLAATLRAVAFRRNYRSWRFFIAPFLVTTSANRSATLKIARGNFSP